jgi:hypothetical protein
MPTRLPFGVFEPPSLASIRRARNAILRPGLRGVVLLELDAPTSHLFDGSPHFGDLDDSLRELPRRPRAGGIEEELFIFEANRDASHR